MTKKFAVTFLAVAAGLPACWVPLASAATPGSLDRSFNRSGFAFAGLSRSTRLGDVTRDALGVAVVRQPGGRLVVAATLRSFARAGRVSATRIALVRLTAGGRLDRTFGGRGVVITDVPGGSEFPSALVRDSRGRLVLAGGAHGRMLLARYTPAGRLDRTFGRCGVVLIPVSGGSAVANGVVVRSTGRILAAGAAGSRAALVQVRADGRLDRGFGLGGKLVFDLGPGGDRLSSVAVAGPVIFASGTAGRSAVLARLRTFEPRRFTAVPDATGHAVALDAQGRPVLAGGNLEGSTRTVNGRPAHNGLMVARFDRDGTLDVTFGQAGVSRLPDVHEDATAIALDSAGRLVVSGPSRIGTCAFLGRLTSTGALDSGFGTGPGEEAAACGISPPAPTSQVFQVSFRGPDGGESEYSGLLVQPDQRIVAVGTMGGDEAGEGDEPVVARYLGG